jgi:hypothetical protein
VGINDVLRACGAAGRQPAGGFDDVARALHRATAAEMVAAARAEQKAAAAVAAAAGVGGY